MILIQYKENGRYLHLDGTTLIRQPYEAKKFHNLLEAMDALKVLEIERSDIDFAEVEFN
jgi:hypothetical protein